MAEIREVSGFGVRGGVGRSESGDLGSRGQTRGCRGEKKKILDIS